MNFPMNGACYCGAVLYRLEQKPMFVNCCHCTDCQKQTGGTFAVNAIIEAASVTVLSGKPVPVRMHTDSGAVHDIYRCPQCQTALWSDYGYGVMLFVRAVTLEHPEDVPPGAHIFIRSQQPWETRPTDAPCFEEFYDREKLWPAESLARRAALLGPGK